MKYSILLSDLLKFINISKLDFNPVFFNRSTISDISVINICAADNVPKDGDNYLIFVGRTAKDPLDILSKTKANIVILDRNIPLPCSVSCCVIHVNESRLFFCELLSFLSVNKKARVSKFSIVAPTAVVGKNISIGDFSKISDDVVIGDNCVIENNVTIHSGTRIGNNVNIYSGTVIGSDGFGYEKNKNGKYIKFPHLGGVIIGDDVDIGANTVIDRGTLSDTKIGNGVKIDNLVHISHNVSIGNNCVVIANAMIAGGANLGEGVWVGPSSNVLDKMQINDGAFVGMGVSIVKDLPSESRFTLKHFLKR